MRWSLLRLLFLTTAVAIAAVIFSQYGRSQDFESLHIRFGGYLAVLAVATSLIAHSQPRMKRFCLTYAIFGWGYLMFELLAGLLFWHGDIYTWKIHSGGPTELGILFGFASGFASLVFPGPIDHSPKINKEVDETSIS